MITAPQNEWNTITEAINYLGLNGITMAEFEQVAMNYTRKPKQVQELFWNEFWAMISCKTAKGE